MSAGKGASDLTAGLVITLVGVLFIPIIASFQGVALQGNNDSGGLEFTPGGLGCPPSDCSGNPNLTGANRTLAQNILTFYLIGYILTLIFALVLPAVKSGKVGKVTGSFHR